MASYSSIPFTPRPARRIALRMRRAVFGDGAVECQHALVRRAFLLALALTYALAFASLGVQLDGLIGSRGILPAAELLGRVEPTWWKLPTLFRIDASDVTLHAVTWGGVGLALIAALGMAPRLLFALLWVGYLSLVNVGGVFFAYQWDVLLLEAGLLAVVFAPRGLWPTWRGGGEPSTVALWLLRWLVFRLMFLSGCVKLASGDPTWAELTALDYHFWSQPLPNVVSWFASELPERVLRFACAAVLVVEVLVPFLVFGPRRLRRGACGLFLVLLGAITLTGNYGFFTLLSAALCITLLDDAALLALTPASLRKRLLAIPMARRTVLPRWRRRAAWALALPVFALTGARALQRVQVLEELPEPLARLDELVAPTRSFNAYGLFASMTRERPEIVVEGSVDGETWQPYAFRWKPGDPERAPGCAGPHMPRLDWQMWFAALRGPERGGWYDRFVQRLLEGEPAVTRLLAHDPFGDQPPRYVRSSLFRYTFTSAEERHGTGAWWKRDLVGAYGPVRELPKAR